MNKEKLLQLLEPKPDDNVVLYSIKALYARYKEVALAQTGGQLAYFAILSLFPFLMLLNQVISRLNIDLLFRFEQYKNFIPENMVSIIQTYIVNLSADQSTGIFTFGAISTVLLASKAIQSLMSALNQAFRRSSSPGAIRIVISFLFTAILIILIPVSILFSSIGNNLFRDAMAFLGLDHALANIWPFLRFVAPLSLVVLVITALYNIIPNKGFPRKYTLVGAIFATLTWMIMAFGISFYTSNFGRYSVIYGSLGAIMIMLLFLYWSGIIIVMGGELSHILAMRSIGDFSYDVKSDLKSDLKS